MFPSGSLSSPPKADVIPSLTTVTEVKEFLQHLSVDANSRAISLSPEFLTLQTKAVFS